jgi:hypothetical protein
MATELPRRAGRAPLPLLAGTDARADIHERGARAFSREAPNHDKESQMERKEIGTGLALCLAACALLSPGQAAAEETKVLHKCVDGKGITAIQAKPCAKGSKEVWVRDAQTEPKQTPAEISAARAREARNQQAVSEQAAELQRRLQPTTTQPAVAPAPPSFPPEGSHLAGATNPPEGSQRAPLSVQEPEDVPTLNSVAPNNCQAAQAFATAVREKTWIGLTDDQMRRIFGWVTDQCRVQTQSDTNR